MAKEIVRKTYHHCVRLVVNPDGTLSEDFLETIRTGLWNQEIYPPKDAEAKLTKIMVEDPNNDFHIIEIKWETTD